ncbi:MAG: zinc ABC transporter substrate-binding protein [Chloroflexi bacterium]|nr:zinc ABC transporter substrate-binding protein [Chloroflexota bacterium]
MDATRAPGTAASEAVAATLRVVATTSILAEVVREVAGDAVEVTQLLPPGVDPHGYQPAPADAVALERATLVFVNGFDLEESLAPLLANLPEETRISASAGIRPRSLATGDGSEPEGGDDPHVWLDPGNVVRWAETIAATLGERDPARAAVYRSNAEAYIVRLAALDGWIEARLSALPPERRLLVTDHADLGWFCDRYGFEQVGTVIPGFSSLAEPSAGDLAALEDRIAALGAKAIFVSAELNPDLAAQVAADTGIAWVTLYVGALSGPEGPAATYEALMRYNVDAIVAALAEANG